MMQQSFTLDKKSMSVWHKTVFDIEQALSRFNLFQSTGQSSTF